jgi:flagellum-specific peptidoglycan hydrolase FlgJ
MNAARVKFIQDHKHDVISSTAGTGLFASVAMAQMIIESSDSSGNPGNGKTVLAANNYFGIKADSSWTGNKVQLPTPNDAQKVSFFRAYNSAKDSVKDHTSFIQKNKRYTNAGVFAAKTPADQLVALQNSGYSESPAYASLLSQVINTYNLQELDIEQEDFKKKEQ